MNNKIYKFLTVMLLLVVSGFIAFSLLVTQVPVFKENKPAETEVTLSDLKMSTVPVWTVSDETAKEYEDLVGKITILDLPADTPLLTLSVKEPIVSKNEDVPTSDIVTFSFTVPSDNIPSDVVAGDLINIIAYFSTETTTTDGNIVNNYALGVSEIATVKSIVDNNGSKKLDVLVSKDLVTDLTLLVERGNVHIIRNSEYNTIGLEGAVLNDLYNKFSENGKLDKVDLTDEEFQEIVEDEKPEGQVIDMTDKE